MDRRVILILSFVIALTGILMGVKGVFRPPAADAASTSASASQNQPTQRQTSQTQQADASAPTLQDPQKGSLAPDFTLELVPGRKPLRLSSLRGKVVVVNFWATWCEPCKTEMPSLVELQKKYGPQGVQIVGVAMDDAEDKEIATFAQHMKVNYLVVRGTEKVGDLYGGVDRMPTTFYLDRSGKVVEETVGLASEPAIEDAIRKSLETEK